MTRLGRRSSRAIGAIGLVLAAGAASAAPFPLELVDPQTGRTARLAPGARALHVVFFATWCSPCTAELAELAELESRWRDGGYRLAIVAVSSRHSVDRLARYASEHEIHATWLFDSTGAAQSALGAESLPTHLVFDAAGKEVARSGALDDAVRNAVATLLRARPPGGRP